MMLYWELFTVFFKIGLFSFGGGLAMISIIQQEVVGRGWIDHRAAWQDEERWPLQVSYR